MANKKDTSPSIGKRILKQLGILQDRMDSVYKDTYSADPQHNRDLEKLTNDIETNISNIMSRNTSTTNISQISQLYAVSKLRDTVQNSNYISSVTDFFENKAITDSIMSSYTENKWITELDTEIDTICKYMPRLEEALAAIKETVLCADNFEKEPMIFTSPTTSINELPKLSEEIKSYRKMYNFDQKAEDWYEKVSKYGEVLIYKIPYSRAMQSLLQRKNGTINRRTSYATTETTLITESGNIANTAKANKELVNLFNSSSRELDLSNLKNLKLEVYNGRVPLKSALDEATYVRQLAPLAESMSLMESSELEKTIPDELEVPKELKARDGLVDPTKMRNEQPSVKVPGLLLKELKRENVIFLYIDDICLGYYYLEFIDQRGKDLSDGTVFRRNSISAGIQSNVRLQDQQAQSMAVDNLLKYLSSMIIQNIDDKFVNANPTLRDAIYAVLKHNDIYNSSGLDSIRVTYIAPEDMEHIKFREDPKTHRGISDLYRSMIPAKLWCCLNLAYTFGILTRGQDKRVYYVKQNVESNIAQTLLTVINQIKKQNFNIMQVENMNSILGITGQYNDYVIPVGPSGDAPINMEVMQGQDINVQTDLMDKLEEQAINSTGIPMEYITARLSSIEFASQLTMTNSKMLRFAYKRQSQYETHLANLMTAIYNTEHNFEGDEENKAISCILPSPLLLNLNNLNQIIDIVTQTAEKLAEYEYPDNNDENNEIKKMLFKKNYVHAKLGGYLKLDEISNIKTKVDLDFSLIKKVEAPQDLPDESY